MHVYGVRSDISNHADRFSCHCSCTDAVIVIINIIVVVTVAHAQIEKEMEHLAVRSQKQLILLHKEDGDAPKNTVQWLNLRDWCNSHHHIRCPKRVFSKRSKARMVSRGRGGRRKGGKGRWARQERQRRPYRDTW